MTLTGSDDPADRIKQLTGRRFCAVRSFILNAFVELCYLTPVFCSHLLDTCFPKFCCQLILHVRCQLLLSFSWPCIRHFENVSAAQLWSPRYTEKGDLLEPFSRSFSLALPFSHEYENTKVNTCIAEINKSHSDSDSSSRCSFPLCLPGQFQLPYDNLKPPFWFSACKITHANLNSSGQIVLQILLSLLRTIP